MYTSLLIVFAIIVPSYAGGLINQSDPLLAEWDKWLVQYSDLVGGVSKEKFENWRRNRDLILDHNNGYHGYKLKMNQFAHLVSVCY